MTAGAAAGLPGWRSMFAGTRGRLVVGLLTLEFVGAVQALITVAILPTVSASLGMPRLAPWTFTATNCASIAAFAVAGRWVDRAGPLVALGLGIPLTGLGLLVAALAPTMPVLVGARAVQGFGLGLQGTVLLSSVATMFPPALRPRLLALTATMWVLPGVIAPGLGLAVTAALGWRWVFGGFLPLLVISAFLAVPPLRRLLRDRPAAGGGALSPMTPGGGVPAPMTPGAVGSRLALAVGAAALLAVVQVPGGAVIRVPLGIVGLGLFALGVRALVRGELRGRHGRTLAGAMLAGFFLNGAYFGMDSVLPLVVHAHGGSLYVAGLALTAASVTWTAGSWWQTRLGRGRPLRRILGTGASITVVGIALTGLAQARSDGRWIIAVPFALGVAALGMGLAYPTVSLLAVGGDRAGLTAADAGTGDSAGLVLLAGALGPAVTIGSLGVLASTGGRAGETVAVVVLAAMAAVAVAIGFRPAGGGRY